MSQDPSVLWERLLVAAAAGDPARIQEAWPGFSADHIESGLLRRAWDLLDGRAAPMPRIEMAARLGVTEAKLAKALPADGASTDLREVSRRVSAHHVRREAMACAHAAQKALSAALEDGDWDAVTGGIREQAARWRGLSDALPAAEPTQAVRVAAWLRDLGRRAAAPEDAFVPSGLPRLDALTGGLRPGHFAIVAGRPGMGKTFLLLALARAALLAGRGVVFVSLEMSEGELVERMTAADAGIPMVRLREASLSREECARLEASSERQVDWPLDMEPPGGSDLDAVIDRIRRGGAALGAPLVCLDYLQLVSVPSSAAANRNAELELASRRLKALARDMGLPIVAAAQLNREVERRANKRPILSDLRDSGSLEQDPDHVWMIHRPGMHDEDVDKRQTELIVVKNRHGAVGTVHADFDPETGAMTGSGAAQGNSRFG